MAEGAGAADFQIQSTVESSPAVTKSSDVIYMHSSEFLHACNRLPRVSGRADMVHSLIQAYGLPTLMKVVAPTPATEEDMRVFHSWHYIKHLSQLSTLDDDDDTKLARYAESGQEYGTGYDCPVTYGLMDDVAMVTGATIQAAALLNSGNCKVAINWHGGWHHAKKDEASGFCYINDIVLGILKLREQYSRVLYVDLDLHHGDGVQDAFYTTGKVMTVSFHNYDAGFFPGTGSVLDSGSYGGTFHTINVPLKEGLRDYEFFSLFSNIMQMVRTTFKPLAVVCQCGVDGLAGDPMNCFNLSHRGLARCVHFLQKWDIPLLLLGGGGYKFTNAAICWAYITAVILNRQLPRDIPDHRYFTDYGPSYELAVPEGNRVNTNTKAYLVDIYTKITTNFKRLEQYKREMTERHSHHFRM